MKIANTSFKVYFILVRVHIVNLPPNTAPGGEIYQTLKILKLSDYIFFRKYFTIEAVTELNSAVQ